MKHKYLILGERYLPILGKRLTEYGFEILPLPDNPDVDQRLAGHTDLSVFLLSPVASAVASVYPFAYDTSSRNQAIQITENYISSDVLFLAPYLKNSDFSKKLLKLGLHLQVISEKQYPDYPGDVSLNIRCTSSGQAILNPKTASSVIQETLRKVGYQRITVNQGYSACSVLELGKKLITQDEGIFKVLSEHRISAIKISENGIMLEGFQHGFIGGCAFSCGGKMYFTGKLDTLQDRDLIIQLLKQENLEPVFLSEESVFDIGGAVVL